MSSHETLIFGSRGSKLALAQTQSIMAALERRFPGLRCELKIIKTLGDRILDQPLAKIEGKGLFVKEIEKALISGEIDVAVHSLKDLPTEQPEELIIAAIPERVDARDVLYHPRHLTLAELPPMARIGTSSLRRSAQLRRLRPDIRLSDIRGNVDTRMRKVDAGEYDATVLAAAGLVRLDMLNARMAFFSFFDMLPAPGQGALAIEAHRDNERALRYVRTLNHEPTALAVLAERTVLSALGGGCAIPLAAFAQVDGNDIHLQARVIHPDGAPMLSDSGHARRDQAEGLGRQIAEKLIQQGAHDIIQAEESSHAIK